MIERAQELGFREYEVISLLDELEEVNKQLAKLKVAKEELEKSIIAAIGHDIEGSRTYEILDRSVTVKTDMIYSLDKRAYTSGDYYLPQEFDPVIQKVSYEVNKKLFNSFYNHSPIEIRNILDKLVEKKPSKPSIKFGARS